MNLFKYMDELRRLIAISPSTLASWACPVSASCASRTTRATCTRTSRTPSRSATRPTPAASRTSSPSATDTERRPTQTREWKSWKAALAVVSILKVHQIDIPASYIAWKPRKCKLKCILPRFPWVILFSATSISQSGALLLTNDKERKTNAK